MNIWRKIYSCLTMRLVNVILCHILTCMNGSDIPTNVLICVTRFAVPLLKQISFFVLVKCIRDIHMEIAHKFPISIYFAALQPVQHHMKGCGIRVKRF